MTYDCIWCLRKAKSIAGINSSGIFQKSNIDFSIASEPETRRILDRLSSLSEQIVKNRHNLIGR
jgi:hypothetical protein